MDKEQTKRNKKREGDVVRETENETNAQREREKQRKERGRGGNHRGRQSVALRERKKE